MSISISLSLPPLPISSIRKAAKRNRFCAPAAQLAGGMKMGLRSRPCRGKLVAGSAVDGAEVEAKQGNSNVSPYLKCLNAFRDSWVLVKGSENLNLEFEDINKYLRDVDPGSVQPKDVRRLVEEEGYTLVDVRIDWSYNEWHIRDAVHIPLQRVISGNRLPQVWRKFGHALFVEFPATESNFPTWLEDMTSRFSPEDKVLIACDMGGLLHEEPSKCVSSSTFEAIYLLHNCGFRNLKYIKGGFCAWRNNEELVRETKGICSSVPWYKTAPGLKEFFPAPCGWTHVKRCEQCDV